MTAKPKDFLIVGVPVHGPVNTEVMMSFVALTAQIQYPAQFVVKTSCYIHDARNKIVEKALESGASHVMFIDADMVFSPTDVDKLLAHDKDIVGGLYVRRQPPHLPTAAIREGNKLCNLMDWPADKLFEVYGLATGFMLIKTSVFRKIDKPWFFYGFEDVFDTQLGDDYYFCHKAHEAGLKVWVDPTIPLGHEGPYIYTLRDYQAYKDTKVKEEDPTCRA